MNIEPGTIFRELEPPPGGAARLRAKLRSDRSRATRVVWLGPIAVGVVAAVTVFAFRLVPPDAARPSETGSLMAAAAFDRLLRRPSEPYELVVRRGSERLAVRQLETRDPTVRVFRIDAVSPDDTTEDESP